jgi:hypothetical protein
VSRGEEAGAFLGRVTAAGSRFRGGLFIESIEFQADRVAFRVFTSRPTSFAELRERMTLRDGVGTDYVMQPFDEIDGRGLFAFVPGVPPDAHSLQFGEPDHGLVVAELIDADSERSGVDVASTSEAGS